MNIPIENPKGNVLVHVNVDYIKSKYSYKKAMNAYYQNKHCKVMFAGPVDALAVVIHNILSLRNSMRLSSVSRRSLKLLKERAESLYFRDNGINYIIIYEQID